jgi:transcriptional regulator with XRE-family HTH domain
MTTRREGLARRRAALGFTQETLAEHLGIDRSTVGRWERGTLTPQPWNQPDLARALKLSLDALNVLLAANPSAEGSAPDRIAVALGAPHSLDLTTVAHLRSESNSSISDTTEFRPHRCLPKPGSPWDRLRSSVHTRQTLEHGWSCARSRPRPLR